MINLFRVIFDYTRKPWKEVSNFIKKIKGRTLDVGCGNGNITKLIKNAVGLDISFELLKKAKNPVVQGKCEALPFKKKFDNVLLIAVLHNLKKDSRIKCLQEIRRVLKGKLFLSVWCKYKPGVKYVKWGKTKRYYYFFKEQELKDLLTNSGFKINNSVKSKDNYFLECN